MMVFEAAALPRRRGSETMTDVLVPMIRTFDAAEFDPAALTELKAGQRISLCLPARNEQDTVGKIVETSRRELVDRIGLIDELLVIDDHSTDDTARVATDAGATVVAARDVLAQYGEGHGKGEALWKSLFASDGDIVVWCDADVRSFDSSYVTGLVGPLLNRPELGFVKGYYERPLQGGQDGGGRVTELVARPALALLFPQLASVVQPLAGEYAGRRSLLERLPFVCGYGVDIALLIDVAERFGLDAVAQVDLGVRFHRNRPLAELAPQATAVLQAVLKRAGAVGALPSTTLVRPGDAPVEVDLTELPPLVHVAEYARSRSSELGA
jgi:glucosyl-3-phosphoglycerate synthase